MRRVIALLFLTGCLGAQRPASAITIPTVPVGDAGNPADTRLMNDGTTGYGSVAYDYRIGTTEVTNAQYVDFLNAVAATDPYGLYDPSMAVAQGGITRSGSSGSYLYAVKAPAVGHGPGGTDYAYADKPVVFVDWGDAARFSNWLNNGQPTGLQDASTTEDGAYTLNGAITQAALNAVTRNADAVWFIPSEDEWYKAAYYDGTIYHNYATGTDTTPDNNLPSADSGNSANFIHVAFGYTTGSGSYPLTDAGAYSSSASPYGTFDQNGNVSEWNEALISGSYWGLRGGPWSGSSYDLAASSRSYASPTFYFPTIGFRVATLAIVPEPSSIALAALGLAALAAYGWRPRLTKPLK
jgi:formylglycine-generating enzyme required for sulfatase activity